MSKSSFSFACLELPHLSQHSLAASQWWRCNVTSQFYQPKKKHIYRFDQTRSVSIKGLSTRQKGKANGIDIFMPILPYPAMCCATPRRTTIRPSISQGINLAREPRSSTTFPSIRSTPITPNFPPFSSPPIAYQCQ